MLGRSLGKGPPLVRAEGLVTGGLPGKRLLGKGPPLGRAEGVTGRGLWEGRFRVLTFFRENQRTLMCLHYVSVAWQTPSDGQSLGYGLSSPRA